MAHSLRLGHRPAQTVDDAGEALNIPALDESWVGFRVLFQFPLRIVGDRAASVVQMGRTIALVDALEAASVALIA